MTRSPTDGLTLVELLIALIVLAVGVLGAFAMQANGLRGTRTAAVMQTLSNMAESELQLQREFERHVTSPVTGESCRSEFSVDGFTCEVHVYPCAFASGQLTCTDTSVGVAVARQITVRVEAPGGSRYEAAVVVR